MTRLSIFQQLQPFSIGFDDVFDHFESMVDSNMRVVSQSNYPPYNIVKIEKNKYDIEVALAGFSKDDVQVEVEDGKLIIASVQDKDDDKVNTGNNESDVLHKGISKRQFKKVWTLADDVEVTGAELKDGMLRVSMEKIIPDHKKPKSIEIK